MLFSKVEFKILVGSGKNHVAKKFGFKALLDALEARLGPRLVWAWLVSRSSFSSSV